LKAPLSQLLRFGKVAVAEVVVVETLVPHLTVAEAEVSAVAAVVAALTAFEMKAKAPFDAACKYLAGLKRMSD
jgi:hypothetical protein